MGKPETITLVLMVLSVVLGIGALAANGIVRKNALDRLRKENVLSVLRNDHSLTFNQIRRLCGLEGIRYARSAKSLLKAMEREGVIEGRTLPSGMREYWLTKNGYAALRDGRYRSAA